MSSVVDVTGVARHPLVPVSHVVQGAARCQQGAGRDWIDALPSQRVLQLSHRHNCLYRGYRSHDQEQNQPQGSGEGPTYLLTYCMPD